MEDTLVSILVIVGVVLIAAAAVWAVSRSRRSRHLRQRFGPEYERAIERENGDRGRAEAVLRDRMTRRDQLELRSLSPMARQTYLRRWKQTQSEFVDRPEAAVQHAQALLDQVMAARGYPNGDAFEERLDLISVDYPDAVQHYRYAHQLCQETNDAGDAAAFTERRRQALVRYRALFAELLEAPDTDRNLETRADRHSEVDAEPDAPADTDGGRRVRGLGNHLTAVAVGRARRASGTRRSKRVLVMTEAETFGPSDPVGARLHVVG